MLSYSYRYDIVVTRRGSFMDHDGIECWSNATSTRTEDSVDTLAEANVSAMEIMNANDSDDVQHITLSLNRELSYEYFNDEPQEWRLPHNPFSV